MAPWSGDRHHLRSSNVGDELLVGVKRPHGYERSGATYPLLVTLDAHWLFGTVSDLATSLSMGRAIPRALVAGIGWPTDDLGEIDRLRNRDLTPTAAPFPEDGFAGRRGRQGLGGASSFRRFVVDELLPYLSEHYRVGAPIILIGHSFSGLFGVDLLLHEPTVFDGYLLASPSLWWDERVMLRTIEPELAPARTPRPARVYLSAGAEEGHAEEAQRFNMVGDVRELARRLCGYPALDVHLEVLDGENHHSTPGRSVSRGLRHLFPAAGTTAAGVSAGLAAGPVPTAGGGLPA